jgi:hypothetical protein
MKEENKDVEIEDYLEFDEDDIEISPDVEDFDDEDQDEVQALHMVEPEKDLGSEIDSPESSDSQDLNQGGEEQKTPSASSFRLMRFHEFNESPD